MDIKDVFRLARMYKDYDTFKSAIDNAMHKIPETVISNKDYSLVDSDSLTCVIDCNHNFQRVERGGQFQGNQCKCGVWEDLT